MVKLLIQNEEGLPEILYSNHIYIDPEAPTDILVAEISEMVKIRIKFTDTSEAESFMDLLFECDKVNLKEIAEDNPELIVTIEEDEDISDMLDVLDDALNQYLENSNYEDMDDETNGIENNY